MSGNHLSMTLAQALAVADKVHAAQAAWSNKGPGDRRAILWKAADLLFERKDAIIAAAVKETGATAAWAGFNVKLGADILREAASMTTQISGELIPSDSPGVLAMAMREPVGIVLGIAPWNAPVILCVRSIAMPLACGNGAILKASENCPETHCLIADVIRDAGVGDALGVVTNDASDAPDIVDALIAHDAVRRVNFTGSTKVGKIIAQIAARELKPALLELGGKAPLVVLDDADLDEAVSAALFGAFMNAGQICMSTERIIVVESVADAFVGKLAERASKLPSAAIGALISNGAADHVAALIDDAAAKGAIIAAGGSRNGQSFAPTIVDHVTSAMRIYADESFGPVAAIIRVADTEAAVQTANDSRYGLTAAVHSRDIVKAMAVARRLKSGMCHINGPTVQDEAQMPFGGVGDSGYGRFGGKAAIDAFTELRWVTIQQQPRHYPF
jgi:vanillin dehydrogenase